MIEKWEYEIYTYSGKASELDNLNEMGNEGWELVAVTDRISDRYESEFIFKRRKI